MSNYDEEDLINPFAYSVLMSDYSDTISDYAELSLDEITKIVFKETPDIISDLPLIKSAVALGKLGWSVKNALVLRNQLTFIQTLRRGNPDIKAIEKRRKAIESGKKWIKKEIETTVVYLERYTNSQKAKYQAKLYIDVINGIITYDLYEELLIAIDQIFPQDIQYFLDIMSYSLSNNIEELSANDLSNVPLGYCYERCRRLEFLGLLKGLITTALGTSLIDKYAFDPCGYYLYSVFKDSADKRRVNIRIKKPDEPFASIGSLSFIVELSNSVEC